MPKLPSRPYSRYSEDAARLLGQLIRRARAEKKLSAAELAQRAGISRGLLQRIEKGDLGCSIGAVFEAAAIVGVRLFDADQKALTGAIATHNEILSLLPKAVRTAKIDVNDDF
jgi:transcriptional regulator with XRE-family HTH domain